MPALIFHAAIAIARLLTPRGVIETIQRMLTDIAIARATTRWLIMAAEQQGDFSSRPLRDGQAESSAASQ
ncbi:hypothetical protein SAMN04490220_6253 [Rhodococcus jostii]|uniref:Uncharacterized protein n=1 Tax=Rhodococcus jostii TaxID=132919 RepID=A0A1H5F419_RHOJO|nr:hypothetical protein SAMN04490220_6253 [Rhodococcus jostii]